MSTRPNLPWTPLALAAVAAVGLAASAPAEAVTCDRHAAPSGSDGASGTASNPYRTAQRLVDQLRSGETGCLAAGATFVEDLRVATSGSPGSPIRLTSAPGPRATLRGRLWVTPDGNDSIFENLVLDGRNSGSLASPEVTADRVTFVNNDVSNSHTGICFALGKTESAFAAVSSDLVLQGNRIHDCGVLPPTNGDHGIYVESTRNARIIGNWIYDNADRGVQLFPDSQGTLVERNVIDGNGVGVIFSGWRSWSSSNNVVRNNVITNSNVRHNIESFWDGVPPGSGNVAQANCVVNGSGSFGDGNIGPEDGFTATGNIVADPGYADRSAKDFSVADGSICSDKVPPPLPPPGAAASGAAGSRAGTPGAGAGGSGAAAGRTTKLEPGTITPSRRFVRGRWLAVRLAPIAGSRRAVITRVPKFGAKGRARQVSASGVARVPLPAREGPARFIARFYDARGRILGGDTTTVVVDRTRPRLGLRRASGSAAKLVARDPRGIRRVRVGGELKKTLTPKRPRTSVATRLRLPAGASRISVVAFDRAGNATVRRLPRGAA